ncbi:MAG: hypothetical protein ACYC7E_04225 [Armatimonadota bacterium]
METGHPSRPAVLAEAGLHADWIVRPLIDAGFAVRRCNLDEVPALLRSGRYNVLVLGRYYLIRRTKGQLDAILEEVIAAVQEFLQAGGGVFFALPSGGVLPFDNLLGPYGARLLNLTIEDEASTLKTTSSGTALSIAYTTAVSGPVADGVAGVWYPTEFSAMMATRPVRAEGKNWQVVLRGMPGSHTERITETQEIDTLLGEQDEGYADAVPIIAINDGLPGRLAVCGIPTGYWIDSPHNFPLAKRVISDGFEDKPSGLLRLLINTLGWLAEPSVRSGKLGGGETSEDALLPQVPRYPDDPPVQWVARSFPPDPIPLRGLIGASTACSSGQGTPAEYAERARDAGLDFIVFLEEFTALTPERFAALKVDCETLSSDTFFAVPGYTIEDIAGNHFFQYGYEIDLPAADILSPDGMALCPHECEQTIRNRTLSHVHTYFLFGELKARCRRGAYLHHANAMRLQDAAACDSIALVTWENGRIVDDAREHYRRLEDVGLRYYPVVITFMNSPAEMEAALASGWRNGHIDPYLRMRDEVLPKHMAPELEYWGVNDESLARRARYPFDHWQYTLPYGYITQGPEIAAWTISVTSRDPEWRMADNELPPVADWFRADAIGFRLRLKATFAEGLAEVRLYDGPRLLRRWQCRGAKEFQQELDLLHDQQRHLMLEVRDMHGRAAISRDYATLRLDWGEFYCADRNNPLQIGFQRDERGLAYGWSGTIYLTYNNGPWGGSSPCNGRWWYNGDSIYPVAKNPVYDEIVPSDGGIRPAGGGLHLMTQMPELNPSELGLMLTPRQELISTDVAICGFTVDVGYDPDWPYFFGKDYVGWRFFPTQPTRYVHLERRAIAFRPRPHGLTTLVYEHHLSFKQDPALVEPLRVGWLDGEVRHVLHRLDGTQVELPGLDETKLRLPWRHGEYLVSWKGDRCPAIFINDGADLELVRDTTSDPEKLRRTDIQRGKLTLRLPVDELPQNGKATCLRFIGIGGTYETDNPAIVETMRKAMGLAGEPSYSIEVESGVVLSRELFLRLDGQGAGVACRIPRADLPMALPVLVEGLNENWPVFLVDRAANRWRPLGMLDGIAYATVDTMKQDWELFIGHPLTASAAEVIISLTQISPTEWALEAHNPTDDLLTVTLIPSPYCRLLEWDGETVALPAGASAFRTITARQSAGSLVS